MAEVPADELAELERLQTIEQRAREMLARLPIEETTAYERGQADALRHALGPVVR